MHGRIVRCLRYRLDEYVVGVANAYTPRGAAFHKTSTGVVTTAVYHAIDTSVLWGIGERLRQDFRFLWWPS